MLGRNGQAQVPLTGAAWRECGQGSRAEADSFLKGDPGSESIPAIYTKAVATFEVGFKSFRLWDNSDSRWVFAAFSTP